MCEQSQGVLNLYRFAEIEAGVENMGREPLVGSASVIHRLMKEYECDCSPDMYGGWQQVRIRVDNG